MIWTKEEPLKNSRLLLYIIKVPCFSENRGYFVFGKVYFLRKQIFPNTKSIWKKYGYDPLMMKSVENMTERESEKREKVDRGSERLQERRM